MKSQKQIITAACALALAAPVIFAAEKPAKSASKQAPAAKAAAPAAKGVPVITDPVAVVEGIEIKKAELDEALEAVLAQNGRSSADLPPEQKVGAYHMLLDDLIVDKLITKRAAALQVSDEEVEATFKKVTASGGSEEEVKAQIEKSGQTVAKVKESIRGSLRQQRWVEDQIKGKEEVTDAEAEAFFNANPDQFKMPERVRASHILLSVGQDATPEAVIAKEKEAQAVLARVKKGEDFNAVAKEVSQDPSAKENGGDLDFFTRDQMVPEFSEVAFKLKKDEISEPVRSQFGYHIIKVTDKKAPEAVALAEAKPRLLTFLKQQKKQTEVEKVVRSVRETADVKINLPPAPPPPALPPGAKGAPAPEVP